MNLHEDNEAFSEFVQLAAETFGLPQVYVEKDYWGRCILIHAQCVAATAIQETDKFVLIQCSYSWVRCGKVFSNISTLVQHEKSSLGNEVKL